MRLNAYFVLFALHGAQPLLGFPENPILKRELTMQVFVEQMGSEHDLKFGGAFYKRGVHHSENPVTQKERIGRRKGRGQGNGLTRRVAQQIALPAPSS